MILILILEYCYILRFGLSAASRVDSVSSRELWQCSILRRFVVSFWMEGWRMNRSSSPRLFEEVAVCWLLKVRDGLAIRSSKWEMGKRNKNQNGG